MLGIHAKRGVEATFERVFSASGGRLSAYRVVWSGKTAAISHQDGRLKSLILPDLNETADITKSEFNNLIGFALHELGHLWFTTNRYWKEQTQIHGQFFHRLVNGLEDPRIEQCVIDSGYANNSRALFEDLVNDMLKDGYVHPNDRKNIPFMLAIEGRRLNGYNIAAASILDRSKYGEVLREALTRKCRNTEDVVNVSLWLFQKIQEIDSEDKQDKQDEQGKQEEKGEQGEQGEQGEKDEQGEQGEQDEQDEQSGKGDEEGEGSGKNSEGREVEPRLNMKTKTNSKSTPSVGTLIFKEIK